MRSKQALIVLLAFLITLIISPNVVQDTFNLEQCRQKITGTLQQPSSYAVHYDPYVEVTCQQSIMTITMERTMEILLLFNSNFQVEEAMVNNKSQNRKQFSTLVGLVRNIFKEMNIQRIVFKDSANLPCDKPHNTANHVMNGSSKFWLPLYDPSAISFYSKYGAKPVFCPKPYTALVSEYKQLTLANILDGLPSSQLFQNEHNTIRKFNDLLAGDIPKQTTLPDYVSLMKAQLDKDDKKWCDFYYVFTDFLVLAGKYIPVMKEISSCDKWEITL